MQSLIQVLDLGSDGIDEVVVGLPGFEGRKGVMEILTVNVEDRFGTDDHPWEGLGIFNYTIIKPEDVGLSASD